MGRKRNDETFLSEIRPELQEREDHLSRADKFYEEYKAKNSMYPTDLLHFPPNKVPEGWVYKWLAAETLGIPDNEEMRIKFTKGWRPVPASRHPEEAGVEFLHLSPEISQKQNLIKRKGLLLCEMPIRLYRELEAIIQKSIQDDAKFLSSAVQTINADFDPRIPTKVESFDDIQSRYNHSGRTFGK